MRYFERLPGHVDLELLTEAGNYSLLHEPVKVALPVCFCSVRINFDFQPSNEEEQVTLMSLQEAKEKKEKSQIEEVCAKLEDMVEKFKI